MTDEPQIPECTFLGTPAGVVVQRGLHREPLSATDGQLLVWGRAGDGTLRLARLMLAMALDRPTPPLSLVRAFASAVVARLPTDGFRLTTLDVLAWVERLGTSEDEDLVEDEQPLS